MKKKPKHTFYNYQFKHTAAKIANHPNIQSVEVAEALGIHPIMLYRWRQEMRGERSRIKEGRAGHPVYCKVAFQQRQKSGRSKCHEAG